MFKSGGDWERIEGEGGNENVKKLKKCKIFQEGRPITTFEMEIRIKVIQFDGHLWMKFDLKLLSSFWMKKDFDLEKLRISKI